MQEIRKITISPECLEAFKTDDEGRLETLQEELEGNNDIKSLLGCYHDSGQVTFNINDIQVDVEGMGLLDVKYIAAKYSGCNDVDLDEEGDMVIDIFIDMATGVAILTGEDWPDRDPDTY